MRPWQRRTRRPRPPTGSPARSRRGATSWSRRRSTRSARGCPSTVTPSPRSPRTSSGTSGRTTTCCARCCAAAGPRRCATSGSWPGMPRCAPGAGSRFADFLEAFRCYHNVVWEAMTDAARDIGAPADEALAAAGSLLRYVDLAATESSAAFLEAQQLLRRRQRPHPPRPARGPARRARPRVGRRPRRGARRRPRRDRGLARRRGAAHHGAGGRRRAAAGGQRARDGRLGPARSASAHGDPPRRDRPRPRGRARASAPRSSARSSARAPRRRTGASPSPSG